ncbi:MAG: hypothetical protein ABIP38_09210 [Steroidobacteraceae bacterium]
MGIAACVSVAAWLGGEMLYAGVLSMAAQGAPGMLGWGLSGGALLLAWRLGTQFRFLA